MKWINAFATKQAGRTFPVWPQMHVIVFGFILSTFRPKVTSLYYHSRRLSSSPFCSSLPKTLSSLLSSTSLTSADQKYWSGKSMLCHPWIQWMRPYLYASIFLDSNKERKSLIGHRTYSPHLLKYFENRSNSLYSSWAVGQNCSHIIEQALVNP